MNILKGNKGKTMSISISISNLAKIKEAKVKINGLTVISGENDTGKSTVGKAIYSIVKSINNYNTSGAYDIKRAILSQMREALTLIRRLVRRRNKTFNDINDKILYYISDYRLPNFIISKNGAQSFSEYKERINSLTYTELSGLMDEILKYSERNQYWNDNLLKNTLGKLSHVVKSYLDEHIQLSTDLLFSLRGSIGKVLVNSMHTDDNGIISLYLHKDEILRFHFDKDILNVQKYDKESFEYVFNDATYIETPLIINDEFDNRFDSRSSFADILNKKDQAKDSVKENFEYISKYIPGQIDVKNGKFSYKVAPKATELSLSSMASGVKSFSILKLLAKGGYIGGISNLLIVDEPENHLHPEWQLKYAELIISLVADGANVILTSHSPYMIEALYYYAKQKNLDENRVAFYYTERIEMENYTIIKETKDLSIIFDKLSKPLESIVWD